MSDVPPNPAMPTAADVAGVLQALSDQYGWYKAMPNQPPNQDAITALARQMYPGYDSFPNQQQQWAWQIANASWFAQNNTPKAGANLTPGTTAEPNLALDAQARQMYGSDSWMLNIPEIRVILETAAQKQWDQQTLEAQVRSTKWWQTTSQNQEEFAQLQATSPEELDFSNPGSQASQRLAHVQQISAAAGVGGLDIGSLQKIALNTMEFGWSDDLIRQALAAQATYNPNATGFSPTSDAPTVAAQLQSINNDYLIGNDPTAMQSWIKGLVAGTWTPDMYKQQAQIQAASKYAWAAPQLQQGLNMAQITSSLRSQAAQLMETDPTQIDFVNNPTYSKILDYVPPGDTVHRAMTGSEASTYLRGTSQWGYTQQARDLAGTWASNLTKTFGKVAQ